MPHVLTHVETGATVHTDSLPSYVALASDYTHKVIDHFNNRKQTDASRFLEACASVFGKRLTYSALTGKGLPETC